ncbi:hypothetical protein [Mycetocola spongiae]|uniref:hypothetical protein n=1 Tax=Mycetocola spongiae TaxID=2859226 RepID=UPI001CF57165|nr:hypothetical protein [Mycetocola spongiae]UCR88116.1 hypothetical protein KXZ72_08905 [Mycetocola spongiae]
MSTSYYRHTLRRELHSPRSTAAILVLIVAILLVAWIAVETVLRLLGSPALLIEPSALAEAIVETPKNPATALIAGGALAALLGLWLLALALGPGRRGRRSRNSRRAAVIVDDGVLASALAEVAAREAHLPPGQVRASVGRRDVFLRVIPTTGVPVDTPALTRAVADAVAEYDLNPTLGVRVHVAPRGTVGT